MNNPGSGARIASLSVTPPFRLRLQDGLNHSAPSSTPKCAKAAHVWGPVPALVLRHRHLCHL